MISFSFGSELCSLSGMIVVVDKGIRPCVCFIFRRINIKVTWPFEVCSYRCNGIPEGGQLNFNMNDVGNVVVNNDSSSDP